MPGAQFHVLWKDKDPVRDVVLGFIREQAARHVRLFGLYRRAALRGCRLVEGPPAARSPQPVSKRPAASLVGWVA